VAIAVPTAQSTRHHALQAGQKRPPDQQKILQEATVNPTKATPLVNSAKDNRKKKGLPHPEEKAMVLNQARVIKQNGHAVTSQAAAPNRLSPEKRDLTMAELRITATDQNARAITAAGMHPQMMTGRNAQVIIAAGLDRQTMRGRNGRPVMTNAMNRPATKSHLQQETNFQKDRLAAAVSLPAVLVRHGLCPQGQAGPKEPGL